MTDDDRIPPPTLEGLLSLAMSVDPRDAINALAENVMALTAARDRLRLAVDAARREGAEGMRERCIQAALEIRDAHRGLMEGAGEPDFSVNDHRQHAAAYIASIIRVLPGATS